MSLSTLCVPLCYSWKHKKRKIIQTSASKWGIIEMHNLRFKKITRSIITGKFRHNRWRNRCKKSTCRYKMTIFTSEAILKQSHRQANWQSCWRKKWMLMPRPTISTQKSSWNIRKNLTRLSKKVRWHQVMFWFFSISFSGSMVNSTSIILSNHISVISKMLNIDHILPD